MSPERRWWQEASHPVWKVAQSAISLVGIVILVAHAGAGTHEGLSPDLADVGAVGGLALGGRLVWQWFKG